MAAKGRHCTGLDGPRQLSLLRVGKAQCLPTLLQTGAGRCGEDTIQGGPLRNQLEQGVKSCA